MIFKKINLTILVLYVFLSGCGFKPLTMSNLDNVSLVKLETTGNKLINFKVGNYLRQTLNYNKNNSTKIIVEINSKKEKDIKEKNDKNEITKYSLSITSKVKVKVLDNNTNFSFTVKKINEYRVHDKKFSYALRNEKKATNEIINILAKDIVRNVLLKVQ